MSSGSGSKFWFLIIGIIVGVVVMRSCSSGPITLVSAVQSGKVNVQMMASGDSGDSAVLTVSRASGTSGKVVVVIPSGTVLYGASSGMQRLMTAVEVRVVLTDETPQIHTTVQTYCLDEFALSPLDTSILSLDPPPGVPTATTVETEPLHKLADCMATSNLPPGDKQLAVWAMKDDLLTKSHEQALQWITDGIVSQMSKERHDALKAKLEKARQLGRNLPEEQIEAAMETEFQNGLPRLRELAASKASQQLASFIAHDKEMLSSCGYAPADKPLFQ